MPGNLSVIYRPLLEIQEAEATELLNRLHSCTDLFEHGLRVANFAVEIAREMDLSSQNQEEIRIASLFHDIGKLFIPNAILHKKFLTSQEWEIILTHSQLGKDILETSAYLRQFGPWVLYHHERFDGSGYPAGLEGEQIPLESRIIAVADSLDAMISHRPYREQSFSIIEAIYKLRNFSGILYDSQVVEILDYICQRSLPRLLMCLLNFI